MEKSQGGQAVTPVFIEPDPYQRALKDMRLAREELREANERIKRLEDELNENGLVLQKIQNERDKSNELVYRMKESLSRVARIAHNGGLVSLSHLDAWTIVRRITVPYWSPSEKIERSRILLTEEMSNHIKECRKAKEAKL
jgi:hypothetical protein